MKLQSGIGAVLLGVLLLGFSKVYADDLISNPDFSKGQCLPWLIEQSEKGKSTLSVQNGELILHVSEPGSQGPDLMLFYRPVTLVQGHTYQLKFKARATSDCQIAPEVGQLSYPFTNYWSANPVINLRAGETVAFEAKFVMQGATDRRVAFRILMGGQYAAQTPYQIAFDDFSIWDEQYTRVSQPVPPEIPAPNVRVNQNGYLTKGPKKATGVCASATPVKWFLKDARGKVVCSGMTTVYGLDKASGDQVHWVDFSSCQKEGKDYKLSLEQAGESFPFDINDRIYERLKYDALAYFYHNRSGIEIRMPYAGRADLVRPAGHVGEVAVSREGSAGYVIDASGGWYDAGDHGKYTPGGGIAVWLLQNQYERSQARKGRNRNAFGDGRMAIPENQNGKPDLLDEARWEMEMLLKMQVPEGNAKAGMAVHDVRDLDWSALGTAPHEDTIKRVFDNPSTTATLNLCAVAAQSSRLWKTLDPSYSQKCLAAAQRAWEAAKRYPAEFVWYPYGDGDPRDEFYWAAAELYLTTGKSEYRDYLKNSPHYLKVPANEPEKVNTSFIWGNVVALGTSSLALAPHLLSKSDLAKAKANIIAAADQWLELMNREGYLVPLAGYYWGSNGDLLNNGVVMAWAYDFTQKPKYLDGAVGCLDYLLGRNGLAQSYITGYGEKAAQNPHHRFWAHQYYADYPLPPAGVVVGGPNQMCQDGWLQSAGLVGSPPQKCYLDHIESCSSNEVAIYWNAALAWLSAFVDENAASFGKPAPNVD